MPAFRKKKKNIYGVWLQLWVSMASAGPEWARMRRHRLPIACAQARQTLGSRKSAAAVGRTRLWNFALRVASVGLIGEALGPVDHNAGS